MSDLKCVGDFFQQSGQTYSDKPVNDDAAGLSLKPSNEDANIWTTAKEKIKQLINDSDYNLWINTINCKQIDDKALILCSENYVKKQFVEKRYLKMIKICVNSVSGRDFNIILTSPDAPYEEYQSSKLPLADVLPTLPDTEPQGDFVEYNESGSPNTELEIIGQPLEGVRRVSTHSSKRRKDQKKENIGKLPLPMSLFPSSEVVRANELCEAKLEMHNNLLANKIFCTLIANINPEKFPEISIPVTLLNEQNDLFGNMYTRAKKSTELLSKAQITKVFFNNKGREKGFSFENIFQVLTYDDGFIFGKFNDGMGQFLLNLKQRFTVLNLGSLLRFGSFYSQRLYEILAASRYKGEIEYDLNVMYEMLAFPVGLRANFRHFRVKVLEQAKKDIELFTDIKFEYIKLSESRSKKIVAIKFIFIDKDKSINYDKNYLYSNDSDEYKLWTDNKYCFVVKNRYILNKYCKSKDDIDRIALRASLNCFNLEKFITFCAKSFYLLPKSRQKSLNAYIIRSLQNELGLYKRSEVRRK